MAVVKMLRISLLALKADRETLLHEMQRMGCVEVTDMPEGEVRETGTEEARLDGDIARLDDTLALIKKYDPDPSPSFGTLPEVTAAQTEQAYARQGDIFLSLSRLEALDRRRGELRSAQAQAEAALEQAEPWIGLDISPEGEETRHTVLFAGKVALRSMDALRLELSALACPPAVEEVGIVRDSACILAIAHSECAEEVRTALEKAGFERTAFAGMGKRKPLMYVADLRKELTAIADERAGLESETAELAKDIRSLKILRDALAVRRERAEAAERFAATGSAFYMRGWVPDKIADKVKNRLMALAPTASIEVTEPEDGEDPPVRLINSQVASAFEPVVEGFALPGYKSFDPTAIMAPFYACLFGMMVSDAGYGLVMAVVIPLFIKIKKIKFRNARTLYLLTYGGIMTVIWGIIYNSFFGFSPLPASLWLLDPVKNSLPVMGLCIGIGALHLLTGLGIAAYMNFKRGDPVAALTDQISWVLLLFGIGMLALPGLAKAGTILALAGAGIVLVMKGRDKKNIFKRLVSGLGALYGVSSWVSDLLSYIRLFGMGVATGIIAMVFNKLIGMVWDIGIIGKVIGAVLFIACHTFNLGINVLGAYVHACRLQYIEFFGKFYEEGGRAFKPLGGKTRYVSILDAPADGKAA
jgi:V/A-type H+/Na+-transporting ATPase subunit I